MSEQRETLAEEALIVIDELPQEPGRNSSRKRPSRPTLSARVATIENRLSAAANLAEFHWANYEALGRRHNELIERHNELVAHATRLTEQLEEIKFATTTRNAVLSQLVALACFELGAKPHDIHRHCENLSKAAFELKFPNCSPEHAKRLATLISDEAEAQIGNMAGRVASYITALSNDNTQLSEAGDDPSRLH